MSIQLNLLKRITNQESGGGKTTRMDDYNLATKIEEAIKNNENLEAITQESI
ncbi:hypothetical protein MTR_0240s0050 [Medicago truncatula]|uniref:Uncharacterized protein n=1 Tax=Medicago truncatula TaxID=3880 RepID=A0A072TG09_MEDTR|nr:hypothetical protein MTR_0240s0050 [Medicago truncatula]